MIFRNSLKSVIRTPAKTILFSLLLIAITAFLCLGVGMWRSSDRLMKQADETFKTTALLEYIGANYPGEPGDDEYMAKELENYDFSAIENSKHVIACDRNVELGGFVEGLKLSPAALHPYKHIAVILFTPKYDTEDGLRCMIQRAYYASGDFYDGISFYITLSDELKIKYPNVNFELGHDYLGVGRFVTGPKRAKVFIIESIESPAFPEYVASQHCNFPVIDVTGMDDIATNGRTAPFMRIAEAYAAEDSFFKVFATSDVESFMEFRNNELALTSGRFFTADEYTSHAKSIIVSEHVAKQMKLELGDTINISLVPGIGGEPAYNCYWPETGYSDNGDYTIVGLFKEMYGYHYTAFIPKPVGEWMPEATVSYSLMRMRLVNGSADELIEELGDKMLRNMRLTIYDQGYNEAAAALKTVKDSAQSLTLICGICAFAIVLLFAYMYIAKQQQSVRIMLALGTGRARTTCYLMIGVTLLTLIAVALGSVAGYYASGEIMNEAYAKAVAERTIDLRFSNVFLLGESAEFNGAMEMDIFDPAIAAGAIFASTLVFSLIMSFNTISADRTRAHAKRGGKGSKKQSLRARLYPFVLAWRSITRNGVKSAVVPFVSICMVILMCVFCAQLNQYQLDLNSVYDNMDVKAYLTSVNGKSIDKLSMHDLDIAPIMDTGYIKSANYTTTLRYKPLALIEHDGVQTNSAANFTPPTGFSYETLYDSINSLEKLVLTNNIYTVPEFYFDEKLDIDFMPGYSAELFSKPVESGAIPGLTTSEYLSAHGYAVGDTIRITALVQGDDVQIIYRDLDIKVVGTYPKLSNTDTIYIPLDAQSYLIESTGMNAYEIRGLVKKDGEALEPPADFYIPEDPASQEYLDVCHKISNSKDSMVFTTNLMTMPDFSTDAAKLEFIDGYSADVFSSWSTDDANAQIPCVLPRSIMTQYGCSLGDVIRISKLWRDGVLMPCFNTRDYIIVGEYSSSPTTIYLPFSAVYIDADSDNYDYMFSNICGDIMHDLFIQEEKLSYMTEENAPNTLELMISDYAYGIFRGEKPAYYMLRYNAVSFTLKNLRDLNAFKDTLTDMGFSTVGKISRVRTFMVIDDQVFMDSVNNLTRHIEYMNILYVAIYAISVGIGFIVSYLLTKTRKPEFAIMRSMGTSRSKTFMAFFIEQTLLCIFGVLLAVGASALFYGTLSELQFYSVLGYFGCYIVGIAIAIFAMNKTNVLQILTARE